MPVWKLSCSGNSIELYKHQLFVGRDDDCDITFKHTGIDIRHSVLNYDQRLGVFRLTDLGSSHGTFVNGESVCEESVPLYVGTRIMFGRNPMVWCVDVGEPSTSHVATENMTPHNYQSPRTNHGYSPLHVPYTSPRTAPMSYSFQTSFPLDRSSQQDPLFCAGKSYLGDSSYTKDKDQSFVPAERKQSSDSCKDPSFSEKIATDSPREPSINSLKTDAGTDADGINSEINTRAKSLYGQPSWWGDGSDSFSTPPSQRKENKPDTPHPNKSIQPPSFTTIITAVPHTDTQPSKDDFSLNDKPVSLFIESRPNTAVPLTRKATEKDSKKPLARQGSYEIESDQLDLSLVRPVIDPDPPYYTPYKNGRKSEVFIVDFGDEKIENKKPIHTTPRNAKQSDKPRVKLAFKETQPIEVTSDSEQELNFSPCINSTPPLAQRRNESVVSESGDEIGEPVTSSTPISILNEDQTTNLSLDSLQTVGQEAPDHKERRKRTTWTAPLEPAKSDLDQSISEVSRNIDTTLTQAYTKTKLLYELLEKHLTPNFHSFSSQQDNTQATLTAMKQMEEKVKSFSNLLSSVNVQELQETLYNLQSTNCNVNTVGFDPGVRRGSFDSGVHSQTEKTTQSFHT